MCLGNDMLSIVEGSGLARAAFEAVRADHSGQAVSMRSALLAEITAVRQTRRPSVKDDVVAGRELLIQLREVGVPELATLLIL
jgi:hypothetical protein